MKLDEIVSQVATSSGIKPGELKKAVDSVFGLIRSTVETGDKVTVPGMGSFVQKTREAGEKVNSKTGEKQAIDAATFLTFKPSKGVTGTKKDKKDKVENQDKKAKKEKKKAEA